MTLPAISRNGSFSLLTLDQVLTLSKRFNLSFRSSDEARLLEKSIKQLSQEFSPFCTGVVLSPEFGYDALELKAEQAGTLFAVERRLLEADPLSVPILTQGWGVDAVRGNYGVAKLEVFYNPTEKEASAKRQLVAEVFDYCQHEGIALLLELMLYVESTPSQYAQIFPEVQLQAAQDFRRSCSVMALEFPLSALSAVTITAELDIPWILTTRETPYEQFKEQLRTVLESGAVGFMGIEPFLPEEKEVALAGGKLSDRADMIRRFIATTGRDRILEASRIVAEAHV